MSARLSRPSSAHLAEADVRTPVAAAIRQPAEVTVCVPADASVHPPACPGQRGGGVAQSHRLSGRRPTPDAEDSALLLPTRCKCKCTILLESSTVRG
jgi:hypothetical protein